MGTHLPEWLGLVEANSRSWGGHKYWAQVFRRPQGRDQTVNISGSLAENSSR